MHLVVVGLNHKTAPVEVREKLAFSEKAMPEALSVLRMCGCVSECCILSTCNRTEVYAVLDSRENDYVITDFIASYHKIEPDKFKPHLYSHAGHHAVHHLFTVAAGLDSMMLGEAQILGQVKAAFCVAGDSECCGTVLNSLFRQALTVGKRARTETEIGKGAFSVGYAAVELAKLIFGGLGEKKVLILGAGKMSELTAKHLCANGVSSVVVSNRTKARADELAEKLGGQAITFDDFPAAMTDADIVISSTGAPRAIVTREKMQKIMRARRERPVFLIDIAVPRDIEPEVADLDNVYLYNIDDLQNMVMQSVEERKQEIEKVREIVDDEVHKFMAWIKSLEAVPLIRLLREKIDAIREGEWERQKGRLSHLSDKDKQVVQAMLQSLVNKIVHQPIVQVKDYAAHPDEYEKLDVVRELFGLEIEDKNGDQEPQAAPEREAQTST